MEETLEPIKVRADLLGQSERFLSQKGYSPEMILQMRADFAEFGQRANNDFYTKLNRSIKRSSGSKFTPAKKKRK